MKAVFENGLWNVYTPSGWVCVGKKLTTIVTVMEANGLGGA